MSSIIRVLSELTINQIAAGEVIENPASVVKELVENALDAKAQNILIEIHGGGFLRILISDDGTGMSEEDAPLSIERYATSKIKEAEDLNSLKTMGFRGEALASIAAISRTTLTTSTVDGIGVLLEVEGGKLLKMEPAPRKRGTTVDVRSLFYNVPARKKFQKSASHSATEVTKVITHLSLAHPHVGFKLFIQEKEVINTAFSPEPDLLPALNTRVKHLFEEELFSSVVEVDIELSPYKIRGYIGSPSHARINRTGQYLFINQRSISSPLISYGIKEGYGTYLQENKHPFYILHLFFPEHLVDVNVHPQKKEVRFAEEQKLKEILRASIRESLQKKIEPPRYAFSTPFPTPTPDYSYPAYKMEENPWRFKEEKGEDLPLFLMDEPLHAIGLYKHYLLLDKEGLVLVDLNRAQARLLFDAHCKKHKEMSVQRLLFPLSLQFSPADCMHLSAHLEEIKKCGFEMHQTAVDAFLIEAIPHYLDEEDLPSLLQKILDLIERNVFDHQEVVRRTLSFANTHKKRFVLQEAISLYQELLKSSEPDECPLGKPISRCLGNNEIEALFFKN